LKSHLLTSLFSIFRGRILGELKLVAPRLPQPAFQGGLLLVALAHHYWTKNVRVILATQLFGMYVQAILGRIGSYVFANFQHQAVMERQGQ
jgi:hypothetical protein